MNQGIMGWAYYYLATQAVNQMSAERLLLPEDGARVLNALLNQALRTPIPTQSLELDDEDDGE